MKFAKKPIVFRTLKCWGPAFYSGNYIELKSAEDVEYLLDNVTTFPWAPDVSPVFLPDDTTFVIDGLTLENEEMTELKSYIEMLYEVDCNAMVAIGDSIWITLLEANDQISSQPLKYKRKLYQLRNPWEKWISKKRGKEVVEEDDEEERNKRAK